MNQDEVSSSKLRRSRSRGWREGSLIKEIESDGVRPDGNVLLYSGPLDLNAQETIVRHAEGVPFGLLNLVQEMHGHREYILSRFDDLDFLLVYSHMVFIIERDGCGALSENCDECVVLAHAEGKRI